MKKHFKYKTRHTPKKCSEAHSLYITNAVTDNKTTRDGSVINVSEENAEVARDTNEEIKL